MPLTFAHPAAVLPLTRFRARGASVSALVIGSMAPDFLYLIEPLAARGTSHGLVGSVAFCVPAGLAVYVAFHLLLKAPLAALLPAALRSAALAEIARDPGLPRRHPLVVVASLWVGSLTHIGWDSLTHASSRVVRAVPLLSHELVVAGLHVEVCRVLQHVSTLAGLAAIAWVLVRLARRPSLLTPVPRTIGTPAQRVALVAALVLLPALAAFAARWEDWRDAHDLSAYHEALFPTVVQGLVGFAIALLLYALAWHLLARRRTRPGAGSPRRA